MRWLNTQPPLEARSASSSSHVKETCEERFRMATASSARWHHGHALPTYKWYLHGREIASNKVSKFLEAETSKLDRTV